MRIKTLDLTNQLVYSPAQLQKPSDAEISEGLYKRLPRLKLQNRQNRRVASEFIAQWEVLVNQFSEQLNQLLQVQIRSVESASGYTSLFEQLTKGITESVTNPQAGLLPNQLDMVFDELKINLEEICFYFLKVSDGKLGKNILHDLYRNLAVCGPC